VYVITCSKLWHPNWPSALSTKSIAMVMMLALAELPSYCIVVTQDGKVFACGEATNGRLGLGISTGNVALPRLLSALSQYIIKKVAVHSGEFSVIILSEFLGWS
jgi:alpha-tubulin suppressor-like RCC1 family protein